MTSIRRLSATIALGAAGTLALAVPALPVAADTPPLLGCTTCTAIFDTVGQSSFDVPANITSLTVTVAGAAGAPPNTEVLPGEGGPGGVTTVDLGTSFAGQTLNFGVGDLGEGSYISTSEPGLVVVAGGGGGGGYAGRLDLPDQVFGTYPGGAGASPTVPGITNGDDAEGYTPGQPANGFGGDDTGGGAGGTGDANGADGGDFTTVTTVDATLALGGAGATLDIPIGQTPNLNVAGAGGGGLTGGGGGGIDRGIDGGDEILIDFVAPGGGGSGYLAEDLSGTAGDPNTGGAYVIFEYTVPPLLPSTGPSLGAWVPGLAALLLLSGAAALIATRRTRTAG